MFIKRIEGESGGICRIENDKIILKDVVVDRSKHYKKMRISGIKMYSWSHNKCVSAALRENSFIEVTQT